MESTWYGFLRRMLRNGWKRKTTCDGRESFSFKYRNSDLEKIVGMPTQRDFIYVLYLKYIAHVCRRVAEQMFIERNVCPEL